MNPFAAGNAKSSLYFLGQIRMTLIDCIFVYGTLMSTSSYDLAKQFHEHADLMGEARWSGRLFHLGSYPGAVESADDDAWVMGELWRLRDPDTALPFLDEYEGCSEHHSLPHEYRRSIEKVWMGDREVSAWMYVFQLPTEHLIEISSGRFNNEG